MIEKLLYDWLNDQLEDPVFMEEPENAPRRFYLLEKTGSSIENHICTSDFALQSYAPSLFEAASMNKTGISALMEATELESITYVELNSDYNYTDTAEKRYRYQAVLHITHYEE